MVEMTTDSGHFMSMLLMTVVGIALVLKNYEILYMYGY